MIDNKDLKEEDKIPESTRTVRKLLLPMLLLCFTCIALGVSALVHTKQISILEESLVEVCDTLVKDGKRLGDLHQKVMDYIGDSLPTE